MARGDELMKEVRDQVTPPSLVYFAKVNEMADWVASDQEKRSRLEKRWRRRYADFRKAGRQKAKAATGGGR